MRCWRTKSFILLCDGVESGFMARVRANCRRSAVWLGIRILQDDSDAASLGYYRVKSYCQCAWHWLGSNESADAHTMASQVQVQSLWWPCRKYLWNSLSRSRSDLNWWEHARDCGPFQRATVYIHIAGERSHMSGSCTRRTTSASRWERRYTLQQCDCYKPAGSTVVKAAC